MMEETMLAASTAWRLHPVDWLLVGIYTAGVLLLGWHYARRQTSSSEYYTGGGRMNAGLIGISLFVTLMSTITYLAQPGEMIKHGPMTIAGLLSIPFSFIIVGYWLIPVLMKQRVTSAYELLGQRLGDGVRLLGATMFVVLRLVWMALMLYITTSALTVILGIDPVWRPAVAACSGLVAVMYTSVGGLRTVVMTDLFQFFCLLLGALLTIGVITWRMGGCGWWPTAWVATWDVQPLYSFDPRVRVTVFGAILANLLWNVCTAGGDQTAVQRYMATVDAAAARRSYLVTSVATTIVSLLLMLVGFALLGYFRAQPQLLPPGTDLVAHADTIFPLFIARHLPVGVTGLVMTALFAAAMSSIDSGVNSITAVVQTDFLDRVGLRPKTEKGHMLFAKWLAFGIGAAIVAASLVMHHIPGNFLELTQKTTNLLVTPIFALFFMALFVPWATPCGAVAGCVFGISTAILVGYWDVLTGQPSLSFQWIAPTALAVNITVGCAVSRWGPQKRKVAEV
ncbi:MAG: sodium-coupled permease [Kiritimatiellia bacterium]|nr:sodium-coupled permease [Lentisphaerota bacterium]